MQTTNVTSAQVKAVFAAAGIKVRVRDLGRKFRVCTVGGERWAVYGERSLQVLTDMQLTDCFGTYDKHVGGQGYELFAYKPGVIVRVKGSYS